MLSAFFLLLCGPYALAARAAGEPDPPLPAPQAILAEAVRPNDGPLGRPLPLACHWNTGSYPPQDTFDPSYQIGLIQQGHHLLPFLSMPDPHMPAEKKLPAEYYGDAIKRIAAWKLPISLLATQWECELTYDKAYFGLPADKNPNVVGLDGKIRPEVDPLGPVGPWREVGRRWTASPAMRQLEQLYPEPSLVLFVSNNEHSKLAWPQAEESRRYLDRYGKGRAAALKRQVFAEGWIERYRALLAGMRDGLASPAWKQGARFIGYEAFGPPHFARWGGWREYSSCVPGRIDWSPLVWDGGTPSYYVHNWNGSTDYAVWSPQIESMNWVFMQEQARKLNPQFWFEISTWDGNESSQANDKRKFYAKKGQTYGPDRYGGMVRFGMWLLRPRAVREFRGWTELRSLQGPYFLAIVAAVDEVYADSTLRRFWRQGRLLPNRQHAHPYQVDVPPEYKDADRWFLLDTNLDPPRPWKPDTELAVFALALVLGDAPEREWLVYAHAPLGMKRGVEVTLPDYRSIKIDVSVAGVFYHVLEKTGAVTQCNLATLFLAPAHTTRIVNLPSEIVLWPRDAAAQSFAP
jgi:hypothetical protein